MRKALVVAAALLALAGCATSESTEKKNLTERQRYDMAERSVRGFLKWVGAKWEETIAWVHDDVDPGSVKDAAGLLARARAAGKRLVESEPLAPEGSPS